MAERVVVMYAGRKVEEASVRDLFAIPRHPYTRALLASIPRLEKEIVAEPRERPRLAEIRGVVPSLKARIPGCLFAPRCSLATDHCRAQAPAFEEKAPRHFAACWRAETMMAGAAE
jgi:peptide/nickel transport system ATP-binding protein